MKGAWASSRGRRGRGDKGRGGGESRECQRVEGRKGQRQEGRKDRPRRRRKARGSTWILVQLNSYESNSRQNVGSGRFF